MKKHPYMSHCGCTRCSRERRIRRSPKRFKNPHTRAGKLSVKTNEYKREKEELRVGGKREHET